MNKIEFIHPTLPPLRCDVGQAESLVNRIDRGEDVGGWKLKNEADRARLDLPAPPPISPQSDKVQDAVDRSSDKGDTKKSEAKGSNSAGAKP